MATVSNAVTSAYNNTSSVSDSTERMQKMREEAAAKTSASQQKTAIAMESKVNLLGSMFGGAQAAQDGFSSIIGSSGSLSNLRAMNSARVGIESRTRNLTSEIRMDQMRGRDTSEKEKALSNLVGNLDLMDKRLSGNVDSILKPEQAAKPGDPPKYYEHKASDPSIITKIKSQLKGSEETIKKQLESDIANGKIDPNYKEEPKPETPKTDSPAEQAAAK